jgi:hypothetical protein
VGLWFLKKWRNQIPLTMWRELFTRAALRPKRRE